ncbi:cytochrome c oxidase assembly protein [Pseudonocardia alaniniphila]|uniref:Bifunctional copper resistance protein CopD/cytochrome c oxidase assembly protein n=1 Tax=Pseudonocardia alaniniphila TaxID=75291 RepID=A0ABS9TV13_9PSEU|nr:cytochrome c oxidase assembly protein [Pseudonocardia alaniniphila]MCH6172193.1 bifunctional copper resistance protein CopD/cytochrome c oxidase assembly protein [Pseudonocardia alaniniphila]
MAHATVEPAATPPRTGPLSGVPALVGLGAAVAVVVAAGLTALTNARPAASLGLPDPGVLTNLALPAVRAATEVCMVLTIGALLLAAFLVAPQRGGFLDVGGYRALRAGSWSAAGWTAGALLMVPLSVADVLGRPVGEVLDPGLLADLVPRLPDASAWLLTAIVAMLVLVGCRTVLTWGWTVVLFGLALFGPLPVALTGHSAGGGAHDIASDSLMLHVLAASLWVGGLVAVIGVATMRGPDRNAALATAVPRFSRVALICWLALAVTGVVNALVRIPLPALIGSEYGALVFAKAAALVVLGVLGAAHRRSSVGAASRGDTRALLRLGGVEVLLMLATMGLAVALGRSAPPDTGVVPSRLDAVIGYDLAGPPTALRLLFDWRFDMVFGTAAIVMALIYLLAVRRLRSRGDTWAVGRTIGWMAGCAALLLGTSSGIGRYAPAMFSVHMGQHMILGMLVPILLVLGAPVTLALRALPPAGRGRPPGPREWLLAAVHSPVARVLTHPVVALVLFVGSYYALYFSGLFPAALPEHWAHKLMNLHFLLVGALFFWPIVGVDPAPRRLPPAARMGLVFASVPFHAFFGLAVMSANTLLGGEYYRGLALPWVPDPLLDQHLGGGMAWAAGEVPLLLVVIALLIQWSRQDERSARRDDRRADADGDAELTAYNAMLRRLATDGPPLVAQSDQNDYDPSHTEDAFRSGSGGSDVRRPASENLISAGQGRGEGVEKAPTMGKNDRPLVEREDQDRHDE